MYIIGNKLSNCITDLGASDNVMSSIVACALGLSLTETFGCCYSMDVKNFLEKGQGKDAQVSLASHPTKRLKLPIFVVIIPTSYDMLLSRSFCRDMEG